MSRNLFGYVRGLKINGESCEWQKPNLYTHFDDKIYEVSVDVGNAAYALFDYLEEYGEVLDEIAYDSMNVHYRIISLSDLCNRLRKEKKAYKAKKKDGYENLYDELYPQLKTLIEQISSIVNIGGIWSENIYLKYYIT